MARQSRPLPILITRPEPQATRFAAQVKTHFGDALAPVLSPMLAPHLLSPALPEGPWGALILTSEPGALAAGRLMAQGHALPLRAYCVGARTASVAQAAGFSALSADGDADALVRLISQQAACGRLLHLRGADSRGDVADRLTAAGMRTDAVIVYRQDPQPLSPDALAVLHGDVPVLVPLFSPRSARLFAAAVAGLGTMAPLHLVALSPAVMAQAPLPVHFRIARRPDVPAVLAAIAELLQPGMECPQPS